MGAFPTTPLSSQGIKLVHNYNYSVSTPVLQVDVLTGKIIAEFPSANAAKKAVGARVADVFTNYTDGKKRRTAKGFAWFKVEEKDLIPKFIKSYNSPKRRRNQPIGI